MPAPKGQTLNKNQSFCSAWLEDKDRHCQILISAAGRKKRESLFQSITQSQVSEESKELVDLHLCKRFHRSTGTHSIQPTERESILREIFSHSPEETSNAKKSKPRQNFPASDEWFPPIKPLNSTNHAADTIATSTNAIEMRIQKATEQQFLSITPNISEQRQVSVTPMASRLVADDHDSAICVESPPELGSEPTFQPTKPNPPRSSQHGSKLSSVRLDERSASLQATGVVTVAHLTAPRVSSCLTQEKRQSTKVMEKSTPVPPPSLLHKDPQPRERLNTAEQVTTTPLTSFVPASHTSDLAQTQKLRRSPRFAKSFTAASEINFSLPTCKSLHTTKFRWSARIEKYNEQARSALNRGRRISWKDMDLQRIL